MLELVTQQRLLGLVQRIFSNSIPFRYQLFNRKKKINITDYESLLTVAGQQPEPERMLFVFLQASLADEASEEEASRFLAGQGGALKAVMCVDKTLDELGSFAELVEESTLLKQDWQIVLIAGLAGKKGVAPTSDAAEEPLKAMVKTVENGGDLSKYIAFDREGAPVRFG